MDSRLSDRPILHVAKVTPRVSRMRGRVYDTALWQRIRQQVLAEEPLCRCGCGRPSTDVDHIDGDATNMDRRNLQGLAHECHSLKTARENRPHASRKLMPGCDADGMPRDGRHHWHGGSNRS